MTKRAGNGKQMLQYAIDHAVGLTLTRAAGEFGEELMAHAIKTDPELKTLMVQLARARVERELMALGVRRDATAVRGKRQENDA